MNFYRFAHLLLIFMSLLIVAVNCKPNDDDNQKAQASVELSTHNFIAGNTEVFERDTFAINAERDFVLQKFKLYLSNIYLINSEGERVRIQEIFLADVGNASTGVFSANVAPGQYSAIEIGLGVDSLQNDQQPEDFEREHPLSSWNQMYWSMLKYRFAILEGRSNLTGQLGSTNDRLHAYHPGTDPLYRVITRPIDLSLNEGESAKIQFKVILDELFAHGEGIDLQTEPQTHSEPVDIAVAIKFMNNLAATVQVAVSP